MEFEKFYKSKIPNYDSLKIRKLLRDLNPHWIDSCKSNFKLTYQIVIDFQISLVANQIKMIKDIESFLIPNGNGLQIPQLLEHELGLGSHFIRNSKKMLNSIIEENHLSENEKTRYQKQIHQYKQKLIKFSKKYRRGVQND